ncbi:MAG: NPCBM/NEW2 domain-containing protein [Victivallaceae bacterium]|nr:NPCBM/NEW2 domain-containing protein [Victivallaceae bacterium]
MNSGYNVQKEEIQRIDNWLSGLGKRQEHINIVSSIQGWEKLHIGRSIMNDKLRLGSRECSWGLGTHADSEIVLRSPEPLREFHSLIGFDNNNENRQCSAILTFSVWVDGKCLAESNPVPRDSVGEQLTVALDGATEFTLKVKSPSIYGAHADWGEPAAITNSGKILKSV